MSDYMTAIREADLNTLAQAIVTAFGEIRYIARTDPDQYIALAEMIHTLAEARRTVLLADWIAGMRDLCPEIAAEQDVDYARLYADVVNTT